MTQLQIMALKVLGVLALLGIIALQHHKLGERNETIAIHCSATRQLTGNLKMDCDDTAAQLQQAVVNADRIRSALDRIARANAQRQKQDKDVRDGVEAAQNRTASARSEASRTARTLEASSRADGPPCEPSEELKRRWK